jgi:hypothetical protein
LQDLLDYMFGGAIDVETGLETSKESLKSSYR